MSGTRLVPPDQAPPKRSGIGRILAILERYGRLLSALTILGTMGVQLYTLKILDDTLAVSSTSSRANLIHSLSVEYSEGNRFAEMLEDLYLGDAVFKEYGDQLGVYRNIEINNLLNFFEKLHHMQVSGALTFEEVNSFFGYAVIVAYNSNELCGYIKQSRTAVDDQTLFHGFGLLGRRLSHLPERRGLTAALSAFPEPTCRL